MNPSPTKPARRLRRGRRLTLVGAISSVILLLFLGGAIWIQGNIRGTEFSPTHFQTRQFSFYEIPLLHLQISPIRRLARVGVTSRYLRSVGLITVPQRPPTDWHLARLSRGLKPTTSADADILVQYLNLYAGSDYFWHQWSLDHPEQAAVLWPEIQRLAERELYVLMPELFQQALQDQEPAALATAIDRYLRTAYLRLALDMREARRFALARDLLTEGAADFPDDAAIRQALADLPADSPGDSTPAPDSPDAT